MGSSSLEFAHERIKTNIKERTKESRKKLDGSKKTIAGRDSRSRDQFVGRNVGILERRTRVRKTEKENRTIPDELVE